MKLIIKSACTINEFYNITFSYLDNSRVKDAVLIHYSYVLYMCHPSPIFT